MSKDTHMIGHTLLRVMLGLLFVVAGYGKFSNPQGVVGLLTGIGFFAPTFFAWVLLLSVLVFGALILIGFKVRYTAWPLAFILLIAELTVVIPNQGILSTPSFFHLVSIAGLATIALTGPGKWAVGRN